MFLAVCRRAWPFRRWGQHRNRVQPQRGPVPSRQSQHRQRHRRLVCRALRRARHRIDGHQFPPSPPPRQTRHRFRARHPSYRRPRKMPQCLLVTCRSRSCTRRRSFPSRRRPHHLPFELAFHSAPLQGSFPSRRRLHHRLGKLMLQVTPLPRQS